MKPLSKYFIRLVFLISINLVNAQQSNAWPDRTVLPIEPYQKTGKIAPTIKDSDPIEWPKEISAPDGAPNVLLIMIDDVGYGATSTFGGPIPTPVFDNLAKNGLTYNRFHTTAVCSSSRAALITGRNHHTAATGIIMEFSTPYPGYNSLVPRSVASIGKILTDNGYGTSWFGKNHNVPDWQTSPAGPFNLWPTGLGFEYFYGFLGADAHQFRPALMQNTKPVDPYIVDGKVDENYILDKDLANKAINWIQTQKSVSPNKPFFVYYTPGTAHAPHQAPKDWIEKFKGKFDYGFEKQRQMTFEKQKAMGIIPKDAKLAPTPSEYQKWDALSPNMKKIVAREMEVYAAQLAYSDYQIGRVIQSIKDMGELDNTLIIYIMGDNGASAEDPTGHGLTSEIGIMVNGEVDTEEFMLKNIDNFGGPWMAEHYSQSWAHAMNTPYQWDKKIASHLGGSRTGMVISWPAKIKQTGQIRSQFTHITDIVPTILEAATLPVPKSVDGFVQEPMAGTSIEYTFDSAKAPEKHTTQYFEIIGNRAIYKDGWIASTTPKILPWEGNHPASKDPVNDYKWELYDLNTDFSQTNDIAAKNPKKLKELQDEFNKEASKYEVYPLDDRYIERLNPENRPNFNKGRNEFIYHQGSSRITEGMAPNMKNTSYSIKADIEVKSGDEGMIITQGGYFGGTALMLLKGKPTFSYAFSHYPNHKWTIQSPTPLTAGKHTIVMNFDYAGGGGGKAAKVTILVDSKEVAKGDIPRTVPKRFSSDETLDVGEDFGTPVTRDYEVPFKFQGSIEKVIVNLKS
ncbi:arylsulfatase [Flavobacterium sp. YJ01]|uniref:arylsulfatase n=1 Tax=Flavobacterium sp. YJ01 TaxID=3031997 RepID=UPI0023E3C88D|nr:arylsulfatase [Flavobacterium sp. YJ01]WET02988.1 arylsulfatase [Flavobacterium sp. YJ01]